MKRYHVPSQLAKRRKVNNEVEKGDEDVNEIFKVPGTNKSTGFATLGLNPHIHQLPLHSPIDVNAFILFAPPDPNPEEKVHVVVDPKLAKVLRPHQREGVTFLWECVTGKRNPGNYGAIMADEMGLGKTLQVISVLWTLLRQSPAARKPEIINAVIIAPASLIGNWDAEIKKWLGPDAVRTMTIGSGTQDQIYQKLSSFVTAPIVSGRAQTPVLIISYESFRSHAKVLCTGEIGLVVCDEGHRLKNQENQTYQALIKLKCKRRIIITGTPIQNDLKEYFSLVNFVSEGLLGQAKDFRRKYEGPIMRSKDSTATMLEKKLGQEAMQFLAGIVDKCMIRRTASINNAYLPQKIEFIVCCKLTREQVSIYEEIATEATAVTSSRLAALNKLRKIVNHPELLNEVPKNVDATKSGKLELLQRLIQQVRSTSTDKFVIISNYTQTLDLLGKLFRDQKYGTLRLDGGMSSKARTKAVQIFNDEGNTSEFILLLSSKAGGCGLNLIGANRLVMFDPDWNPANDAQAMARIWREGQQKRCFVYRLIGTGTLEERILHRQVSKKSLSSSLIDHDEAEAIKMFNAAEMKQLFKFQGKTNSVLHDSLDCKRCSQLVEVEPPPTTSTITSDLVDWYHSHSSLGIPDDGLRNSFSSASFAFYQYSHLP